MSSFRLLSLNVPRIAPDSGASARPERAPGRQVSVMSTRPNSQLRSNGIRRFPHSRSSGNRDLWGHHALSFTGDGAIRWVQRCGRGTYWGVALRFLRHSVGRPMNPRPPLRESPSEAATASADDDGVAGAGEMRGGVAKGDVEWRADRRAPASNPGNRIRRKLRIASDGLRPTYFYFGIGEEQRKRG